MTVSAVQPAAANAAQKTTTAAASATLDYNSFLQLLIAQIKNQDPLNPMDSTEYVSQLASFSSVEQAIKTNNKLDGVLTSLSLSQADGLIGRTVTGADGGSGVIESLRITASGVVAILAGGREMPLGAGVTLS